MNRNKAVGAMGLAFFSFTAGTQFAESGNYSVAIIAMCLILSIVCYAVVISE